MPRKTVPKRLLHYRNKIKASAMFYIPIDALEQISQEAAEMQMSVGCYVARLMYATGGLIKLEKGYRAAREALGAGQDDEQVPK